MSMHKILLPILLLAATALPARAQSVDVDAIRARLAREENITELRKRELSLMRASATNQEAHLERGLVLLRLFQLTKERDDAKQAHSAVDRFKKKFPKDARGEYALGLVTAASPDLTIPSPKGILNKIVIAQSVAEVAGRDPVSRSKAHFKRALELDPQLVGAAIELGRVALDTRDKDAMRTAADALRPFVGDNRVTPDAATTLSQLNEALGDVQAAAVAADAAVTASDGKSASALHARAAALLRQPERLEDGARAWFEGVEALSSADEADVYYEALVPIVTEREKHEWQTGSLDARKQWLRRFWTPRAAAAGITPAERMADHYKRLAQAQTRYRRIGKRGGAPQGALISPTYNVDQLPFDERGVMLIRHGEPMEIVRTSNADLRPNETWVYRGVSGRHELVNFVVLRDGPDFRLVDDILQAVDPTQSQLPTDAIVDLLRDRVDYEPRYGPLAAHFEQLSSRRNIGSAANLDALTESATTGMGMARQLIATDNREVAFRMIGSDSDRPAFASDLPFYYDLFSFRGENGLTDVAVAAAVPGRMVSAQMLRGQYVYSFSASLIFMDTLTGELARKDTIVGYTSDHQLGEDEYIRVNFDVPTPASKTMAHRIVLRDLLTPGRGQLYGGDAGLKNFAGNTLQISDIVLAAPEQGTWRRGAAHLAFVPPRQFVEKQPLRVFYEVYNLPAGTDYRTEIGIAPAEGLTGFGRMKKLFGGNAGTVKLQFDNVAPAGQNSIVQESREVTTQVKPGKYRVFVRVTNLQNQQTVRTETMFVVLPAPKKK